jgi:hypothetical protein
MSQEYFMYQIQFCTDPGPFSVEFSLCYASVASLSHDIMSHPFEEIAIRDAALACPGPAIKDREKSGPFGSSLSIGGKNGILQQEFATLKHRFSPPLNS